MRIIEPARLQQRPPKKRSRSPAFIVGVILVAGIYILWSLVLTVPALQPGDIHTPRAPLTTAVPIQWPAYGQAAIGAQGYGALASSGEQVAKPTASIAKVMTALAVLKQKPLTPGDQGPMISITDADVASFDDFAGRGGAVVPVIRGQTISQYQALQALLLPSSNNMAFTLARWAFSSEEAYTAYANSLAKSLGMKNSFFADASGFSPQTVSTARDLILLGQAAMQNKVIAEIVGQPEATIAMAGRIRNTNWMLGTDGVIGMKTGNTAEAGGCYLFAARHTYPSGQAVTFIGVVLAAPNMPFALRDAKALLTSAKSNFETVQVAAADATITNYSLPWQPASKLRAKVEQDATIFIWKGTTVVTKVRLHTVKAPVGTRSVVGQLEIVNGSRVQSIPIVLDGAAMSAPLNWRLAAPVRRFGS